MTLIKPMNLTPEQMEVLELSTEDYGYFFWAVGYVSRFRPELPYEQQKEKGQQAVRGLLAEGLITLFRGTTFTGTSEVTELMPEEWEAVLADPLQWDWQQYQDKEWADGEIEFRYGSTEKGETVYREDEQVRTYFKSRYPQY